MPSTVLWYIFPLHEVIPRLIVARSLKSFPFTSSSKSPFTLAGWLPVIGFKIRIYL